MIALPSDLWERTNAVADALLGPIERPLAALLRETSILYTRDRERLRGPSAHDVLQARLRFYFARDLPKIAFPLAELRAAGRLPGGTWRVLDLGAGFGTTSLGASLYAEQTGAAEHLRIDAFDFSPPALEGLRRLSNLGLPTQVRTFAADLRRFEEHLGDERYDLVLLGLVLNELSADDALTLVRRARARLSPGGALVILEPALRDLTRRLMKLRDQLASDGWPIFAPCPHRAACPMLEQPRHWCHEERDLLLPPPLARVATAAGLRDRKSTFAYLTIADGPALVDAVLAGHDGLRRRVVSSRLASKGKLELVGCGVDGTLQKTLRLRRHEDEANRSFGQARRGDLICHEGACTNRVGPGETVIRWSATDFMDD